MWYVTWATNVVIYVQQVSGIKPAKNVAILIKYLHFPFSISRDIYAVLFKLPLLHLH